MKTEDHILKKKAIQEIKQLKIKCSRCKRAYATIFYLGKAYCKKHNPKPKKQSYRIGGRF